jgi:uncharacterized membrane protein
MALATAAPRRTKRAGARSQRALESDGAPPNVARTERIGSVALGAALVTYALRQRDPVGVIAAMFGSAFLLRGATGHCPVYHAMGVSTGSADAVLGLSRDDLTSRAREPVIVETAMVIVEPAIVIEADSPAL